MSSKLRDLIRSVRACKTAAEERAVIAKECADIRTSFKNKDDDGLRHRNVAKLLYIHLLGYPSQFGQMEAMKLVASSRYAEKRIGYLALMILLDEQQEVLMLVTNSMKRDLHNPNPYVAGLALCALANISSIDIARDLSFDVTELLSSTNPYLRKKAALCAVRIIRKVPDLIDDFIPVAGGLLNDRNNAVQLTGIALIRQIIEESPETILQFRSVIPRLIVLLKTLWSVSYSPEYDVMGLNDPFLQVSIIRLLRFLCTPTTTPDGVVIDQDEEYIDRVNDILANVTVDIDPSKVPGAAIHYEAIVTVLTISNDPTLRLNAIVQLGRFLQSKDNNIRYISLNSLYQIAKQHTILAASGHVASNISGGGSVQQSSNIDAIQRYRNIIVAYLKDPDPSIRRRALALIYALVNELNVRPLIKELLIYLAHKPSSVTTPASTMSWSSSGASSMVESLQPVTSISHITSTSNYDFKTDLTNKIYYIINQFAPSLLWQFQATIALLSTDNTFLNENIFLDFISLIQQHKTQKQIHNGTIVSDHNTWSKIELNAFIIYELFYSVNQEHCVNYHYLVQSFLFFLGQHPHLLLSKQYAEHATRLSQAVVTEAHQQFIQQQQQQPHQQQSSSPPAHGSTAAHILQDPTVYSHISPTVLVSLLSALLLHPLALDTTREIGLTTIARIMVYIEQQQGKSNAIYCATSLDGFRELLSEAKQHYNSDIQQRGIEYSTLGKESLKLRQKVLFPVATFSRTNVELDVDLEFSEPGTITDGDGDGDGDATKTTQNQEQLASSSSQQQPQKQEIDIFATLTADAEAIAQQQPATVSFTPSTNTIPLDLFDTSPVSLVQDQPLQQQPPQQQQPFDLFSGFPQTTTTTPPAASTSTAAFDIFSSSPATSPSAAVTTMKATVLQSPSTEAVDIFDIAFNSPPLSPSAVDPTPSPATPRSVPATTSPNLITKTIYRGDSFSIQFQYIQPAAATPRTYNIKSIHTSNISSSISSYQFDIGVKSHMTKSAQSPSSQTLTQLNPITQSFRIVNDSAPLPSLVRCRVSCVVNGQTVEIPPFTVEL